jgi:hypothetical protein
MMQNNNEETKDEGLRRQPTTSIIEESDSSDSTHNLEMKDISKEVCLNHIQIPTYPINNKSKDNPIYFYDDIAYFLTHKSNKLPGMRI